MSDILNETDVQTTKRIIEKLLCGEGWKTGMFANKYLPFSHIYETEEQVRQSPIFPYGGFNNPETVEDDLKGCLLATTDKIAEWMEGKKRTLRLEFNLDYDIGYTVDSPTAPKRNSRCVVLALRRDTESLTQNGFFVSAFNVI